MSDERRANGKWILAIMAAVFVWGTFLAVGAGLFGIDPKQGRVTFAPNILRGAIVMGCVLAFLGFWSAALWSRNRRSSAGDPPVDR
ncbi:MAG: hypothetical protein KatS3mg110_3377 [Pirellulaceae bacterium]|nr:MAG: hypothetical protein KatS3mg110_3377 [Pirellulaceae bacterium]